MIISKKKSGLMPGSLIFVLLTTGVMNAQVHFTPVEPTGVSCAIVVQNATINGVSLQNGDEIGVFDGSLCVGAGVYGGSFPVSFSAIGKYTPPGEPELPGYTAGNNMIFKVWQSSSDIETSGSPTFTMGGKFGDVLTVVDPLAATIAIPTSDITITTSPAGLEYVVDGTTYTSSQTFTWDVGSSHTLNIATSPQSGGAGTRYVYASWSDGGAQSHSYTVPSSDVTVTAHFTTQYQLTVNSTHGNPQGAGWYDSGISADFSVSSPDVQGSTRYVFTSWSGDYSGTSPSGSVTMSSAKSVTAGWQTQYQLTVNSTYGNPQGAGWYDSGISADFSVSSPDVQGSTRYVFTSWSGDYSGTSPSGSVTMSSAKSVTAGWQTQYQLTVNSAHGNPQGAGWYDAGASATFSVTSPVSGGEGTRYVFTGWTGTGSGSYTGSNLSSTVTMNNPITEDAGWQTQYYLTTAENPDAGGDMTPAPPGSWYDSGTVVDVNATVNEGYSWGGWSGDLSGTTRPTSITMSGPRSVTANFIDNTDVSDDNEMGIIPNDFQLGQNYPNPFNPETHIVFALPRTGQAQLTIYNINGKQICRLFDGTLAAGYHEAVWRGVDDNGRPVSSGIYFYVLQSSGTVLQKKCLFMK